MTMTVYILAALYVFTLLDRHGNHRGWLAIVVLFWPLLLLTQIAAYTLAWLIGIDPRPGAQEDSDAR